MTSTGRRQLEERQPPSPPPRQWEVGSGEAPPPGPPIESGLCDLSSILMGGNHDMCTLSPAMSVQLTRRFRDTDMQRSIWRTACLVSIGVVLSIVLLWVRTIVVMRRSKSNTASPHDVEVVYLRPDAWPMHVVHPDGDGSLTMPVEPCKLEPSLFIQMASPYATAPSQACPCDQPIRSLSSESARGGAIGRLLQRGTREPQLRTDIRNENGPPV